MFFDTIQSTDSQLQVSDQRFGLGRAMLQQRAQNKYLKDGFKYVGFAGSIHSERKIPFNRKTGQGSAELHLFFVQQLVWIDVERTSRGNPRGQQSQ